MCIEENSDLTPQETILSFEVNDKDSHRMTFSATAGGLVFVSATYSTYDVTDYGTLFVDIISGTTRYARNCQRTDVDSAVYRSSNASAMIVTQGSDIYIDYGSSIKETKIIIINIVAFGCTVTKV